MRTSPALTRLRRGSQRVTGTVLRPVRRRRRDPFPPGERPVLVHCGHHKVGTVWFDRVLRGVGFEFGLRVSVADPPEPGAARQGRADIVIYQHSRHFSDEPFAGRRIRGTHLLRDPRDVVVSAFRYHLWTTEPWALRPNAEFNGQSYRTYLRSLDPDDGLAAEIHRSAKTIVRDMLAWDYSRPDFLELRYEDLLGNEHAGFETVFRHYGFEPGATRRAACIADRFSFQRITGREVGDEPSRPDHLRSGRPGEWRKLFRPRHIELFSDLVGDGALRQLGYEP